MMYRCIVFDYDNTIVASLPDAQYGAVTYACQKMGIKGYTKDQFLEIDAKGRIGDDIEEKYPERYDEFCSLFYEYLDMNPPKAYDGMKELMDRYRSSGGVICIVSNSTSDTVKKGLESNGLPKPDIIYGWEAGEMYRKPNTTSLYEISLGFGISPMNMLVIDDKPNGIEMARSFGADHCISGWGIFDEKTKTMMKGKYPGSKCFDDVKDLESILF